MSARNAARDSWVYRWVYRSTRALTRLIAKIFFRAQFAGVENVPATGGGLICANHQSYLDPFLVGMSIERFVCFVARDSLFRWPVLRQLLYLYDTIPIRREGIGLSGLKEVLRRVKRGELVLIFPEGTRSPDGSVGKIQPGFSVVAKRTGVPIVPVAVDGAFHVWPRHRKLPRLARVAICIGEPIGSNMVSELSEEALVAELLRRIEACHNRAREMCER